MSDIGIGRIIVTDQKRDAVHISVAPVTAWKTINPGEHVGLKEGDKPIGIVDPFLKSPVKFGQRFWLLSRGLRLVRILEAVQSLHDVRN